MAAADGENAGSGQHRTQSCQLVWIGRLQYLVGRRTSSAVVLTLALASDLNLAASLATPASSNTTYFRNKNARTALSFRSNNGPRSASIVRHSIHRRMGR